MQPRRFVLRDRGCGEPRDTGDGVFFVPEPTADFYLYSCDERVRDRAARRRRSM